MTEDKKYDSIVVLAHQPDYRNWQFPSHTYKSLDRALELWQHGVAPFISLCGDHALKFDHGGVKQPFKESDKMEEYLISQGAPPETILKEGESRDTISNFYYLKRRVFKPHKIKKILIIIPDFRIKRVRFLAQKVLGPDYTVDFEPIEYRPEELYVNEDHTLMKQKEFLKDMPDGDDSWLDGKFFTAPMYQYWRERDLAEKDPEKRLLI